LLLLLLTCLFPFPFFPFPPSLLYLLVVAVEQGIRVVMAGGVVTVVVRAVIRNCSEAEKRKNIPNWAKAPTWQRIWAMLQRPFGVMVKRWSRDFGGHGRFDSRSA
jgi:hypothetical protein